MPMTNQLQRRKWNGLGHTCTPRKNDCQRSTTVNTT